MNRAKMLALVLYTGCDCNYAMCKAERSGDYATWRWFSYLLYGRLSARCRTITDVVAYSGECVSEPVSDLRHCSERPLTRSVRRVRIVVGIPRTRLVERPEGGLIRLTTHTSTSRDRRVAERFMGDDGGMLVEIRRQQRLTAADVSWVSKFPSERETLFRGGGGYGYEVRSVESRGGKQLVVLEEE